jgi:6-phospho-beta-glucosidase
MKPIVITIIGGGAFTPRLCEVLASTVAIPELELRLSARRADRLQILAHHSARRLAAVRPGWSLQGAHSLEAAVEGATVVVLLVRVGGLEARAWDEEFPTRFGLAGDEGLGPGGIANAWRTVPELARIAQTLQRTMPATRVINLMAPLGITTRVLLDHGLDAIGVCELPLVTLETWLGGAEDAAVDASWRYGGLNHLGWFWDVRENGQDVLRRWAGAPVSRSNLAPVDVATLEQYHAAPLRYFYEIFDREAGRRLKLERSPDRARQLIELSEALIQRFSATPGLEVREAEARPTPWLDRAVAPIASALLGGSAHAGFANLRNEEKIPELPSELVVEVAATYTANGASPAKPGPLPAPVSRFLRHAGEAEALTYQAATQRNPGVLAQAIRALPLSIPENMVSELARLAQQGP